MALQAEIRQLMRANVIPGAVVLIRSPRRGDWSAAFGTRALGTRALGTSEPMTLADHFRVGSNTKTMTATVILQLVQEGKLRLDDPVAKHVAGVPNGERITIANQLDPAMQRLRLVSIRPTEPGNPAGAGYGLGIVRFGPAVYGHDGQIPGFMSFMGHDPRTGDTIVVATNLAAVPGGEGSALVLAKAVLRSLCGAEAVPRSDPAAQPLPAAKPAGP